jgi:hypothetical protein
LRERWHSRAQEIGLDRETIGQTFGRRRQGRDGTVSIAAVETTVTAHASHFDRRDAIQAVAQNLPAGAPATEVEELADAYLAGEGVIPIGESAKGAVVTTTRIWELERRALAGAAAMAATDDRAVAGELIAARVIARRGSLKADQRAMVERLLTVGEGLAIVVGEAGSGKTYAVLAAAEGWTAAGIGVRVAAPTWRAANVLRSEGLPTSTSIARLLGELDREVAEGRPALASGSVLLIDEAGMVDSATLARLIDHAEAAEAKLVLVGDPAQLGEIEAGGLFASLVDRSEPIVLDEVIRHSHELDREGALRIREGRGGEALSLYRAEERVVIAETPEARREAMVADWWQSHGAGEDALMVAKRNAEVERLNALAREVMKAEGRLGEAEIEVGEARFAAGDRVITRVNDNRAGIYNRERWRVAEVDPVGQAVVLDGIDTPRRLCVDSVYLGAVNPNDGAPALQHAYAATTYQAQGATVDRAYVMADPSMDRQEFYVAASRSREETWFYATPEIQVEREEYAPRSPHLREGLEHIAEAAERNGAQVSAHDQAMRSALGKLPSEELALRLVELRAEVGAEEANQQSHRHLNERLAETEARLERIDPDRRDLGEPPAGWRRRDQRQAHAEEARRLDATAAMSREAAERMRAELGASPPVEHQARAELAVIDHLLAERERAALAAARISPPGYIVNELGERPAEAARRETWDAAVRGIEGYRQQHGIRDRDTALGAEPGDRAARLARERAAESIRRAQRRLELEQARQIERSMEIEL